MVITHRTLNCYEERDCLFSWLVHYPLQHQEDIVVNMDGGVGGSWEEVEYIEVGGQKLPMRQNLPQNCQEPFITDLHD